MSKIEQIKRFLGRPRSGWEASNYKKFKRLGGKYRGKRCFIMGNGPSLNKTPLELLENEFVFGVNRCHLLYDRIKWRPKFFCAMDWRVTPNISPEIFEQTKALPDTTFFLPKRFRDIQPWQNQENIVWMTEKHKEVELGPDGYFSTFPPDFIRVPNTVTIGCIQLAVFLGFDPIYLVGCDTKFVIPVGSVSKHGKGRDPGTGEIIDGFNLTMEAEKDDNHFHPDYLRKGDPWSAPNIGGQIYGYTRIREKCDDLGVDVFNATVEGELEVFPRVEINSLILGEQ